jgi:hypothetical protein
MRELVFNPRELKLNMAFVVKFLLYEGGPMTRGQMLVGLYYFGRYTGVQANTGLFWHEDEQVGSTGFPFILPSKFYTFAPPDSQRKKLLSHTHLALSSIIIIIIIIIIINVAA